MIVTFGELMLRLSPTGIGRFVQSDSFRVIPGGGEANVAISLANFGEDVAFVTKLPSHEIGQMALNAMRRYLDDVIYMPIVDMNDAASITLFKDHLKSQPCAFELCFKSDDQYVKQASQMAKGKSLLWVNTLWDTLCGGHEDDKALLESPDAHYGYLIDTLGVHIIQTDRPAFVIDYLKQNNVR